MSNYFAVICSIIAIGCCIFVCLFTTKERNRKRKELSKKAIGTLIIQDDTEVYMLFNNVYLDKLKDDEYEFIYIKKQYTNNKERK